MPPKYQIKWAELWWAIAIGLITLASTAIIGIEEVSDWKAWAVSIVIAAARVIIAAAMNAVRQAMGAVNSALAGTLRLCLRL